MAGKGNNPNIATLQAKIETLTNEVHKHNTELAVVKNDTSWIKDRLDRIDTRTWGILSGIIISILVSIALRVL